MGWFGKSKVGKFLDKSTQGVLVDPVKDLSRGEVGKSFADAWQNSPGGQAVSGIGQAPEKLAATWKGIQGEKHKSGKADEAAKAIKDNELAQYGENQKFAGDIDKTDDAYLGSTGKNSAQFQHDTTLLEQEIQRSQKDAGATYSNDIQPRLKSLMEGAQKNSASAMSLQDAMDPNNSVAKGTRALYNDEGTKQRDSYNTEAANTRSQYDAQGAGIQKQYELQAQNEGKQGMADAGILGALGMQNMAGQLGGVPMSGGQLQALMGANQAQTGAAYSKTLQRGQSLRDQGIQGNIGRQTAGLDSATVQRNAGLGRQADLGTQGLAQGFARSDVAYGQGLQAQDRYRESIGDYEGASDRQLGRDKDFRGQRNDISKQTFGIQQGLADTTRGVGNARTQRNMAIYNTHMGGQQANIASDIAGINAGRTASAAQTTGALQAGGTVAGAVLGGPGGAAAGNEAGQAVGQGMAPDATAVPSTPDYSGSSAGSQGATEGGPGLGLFGRENPYDDRTARGQPARQQQAASGGGGNPVRQTGRAPGDTNWDTGQQMTAQPSAPAAGGPARSNRERYEQSIQQNFARNPAGAGGGFQGNPYAYTAQGPAPEPARRPVPSLRARGARR